MTDRCLGDPNSSSGASRLDLRVQISINGQIASTPDRSSVQEIEGIRSDACSSEDNGIGILSTNIGYTAVS